MTRKASPEHRDSRVLLIDVGNTRIKWAVWRAGRLGRMQAATFDGWSSRDYERRIFRGLRVAPSRVLVASVAGPRVARLLTQAARDAVGADPQLASTVRRAAGVVTRYTEPWRLGVDRFMGAIAAHQLAGTRGACIVNVGTAVTIDLVDGRGVHLGGAILPGARLMVESLLRGTAGIERRARGSGARAGGGSGGPFARNTGAAIERGARHAVAAAIEQSVTDAREVLARPPLVILTGGGMDEVRRRIRARHVAVPDLVLRGIALQAGLAVR